MSRSGLFNFENEPIWLIQDSNNLFFFNRFGRTVSVIRDTRFGIGRTVPTTRDTRVRLVVLVYCQARATPNDRPRPNAATTVDYRVGQGLPYSQWGSCRGNPDTNRVGYDWRLEISILWSSEPNMFSLKYRGLQFLTVSKMRIMCKILMSFYLTKRGGFIWRGGEKQKHSVIALIGDQPTLPVHDRRYYWSRYYCALQYSRIWTIPGR
jgi:hypothetical protein